MTSYSVYTGFHPGISEGDKWIFLKKMLYVHRIHLFVYVNINLTVNMYIHVAAFKLHYNKPILRFVCI